jgi:heme a synthase
MTGLNIKISLLALVLAYSVIVLGAYVRLSDAGLGCPDWPGCYGELFVPTEEKIIEQGNQDYLQRPLVQGKAWKEMAHRYAAGILGLLILFLTVDGWRQRYRDKTSAVLASSALLCLVTFQAALGMWTVTLLLKPVIVTSHLLGGMAILSLLHWQLLNSLYPVKASQGKSSNYFIIFGLVVVYCQIALGGWTSANYAALICTDFPTCQGQWWPQMNFDEGFVLWRGLGVDYEGGVLDASARTAVHVSHRLGALITFIVVLSIAVHTMMSKKGRFVSLGVIIICILLAQVSLGIANVLYALPLPIAVAHNGVAALLLLSMVTLVYFSRLANEA